MKGEAAVAILASEGMAQAAVLLVLDSRCAHSL